MSAQREVEIWMRAYRRWEQEASAITPPLKKPPGRSAFLRLAAKRLPNAPNQHSIVRRVPMKATALLKRYSRSTTRVAIFEAARVGTTSSTCATRSTSTSSCSGRRSGSSEATRRW